MKEIVNEIASNIEYLYTTDSDAIPCISVENLSGILVKFNLINKKEESFLNEQ